MTNIEKQKERVNAFNEATLMGGHTAVAWFKKKGSYLLERVIGKPLEIK